mmetsp:Transcript_7604/g.22317  ORF Transcript_7604/g.22317 Transcript_7604/m.22317 type:complete len:104 (-) Transcript_7604:33-344(-)
MRPSGYIRNSISSMLPELSDMDLDVCGRTKDGEAPGATKAEAPEDSALAARKAAANFRHDIVLSLFLQEYLKISVFLGSSSSDFHFSLPVFKNCVDIWLSQYN